MPLKFLGGHVAIEAIIATSFPNNNIGVKFITSTGIARVPLSRDKPDSLPERPCNGRVVHRMEELFFCGWRDAIVCTELYLRLRNNCGTTRPNPAQPSLPQLSAHLDCNVLKWLACKCVNVAAYSLSPLLPVLN